MPDAGDAKITAGATLCAGLQKKGCEYKFYTEFQSHEPEFDYLKSLEIEEKINKIKWCKRQNAAHFLLSTNGGWCDARAATAAYEYRAG